MSLAEAKVETAFSFLEVMGQTEFERAGAREQAHHRQISETASKVWADTDRARLIANATWVTRLIDSELLAVIEGYIRETPLQLRRNGFSGEVTLVTPGLLNGLRDTVAAQRRASEERSEEHHATVDREVYLAMLREGVVDWTLRTKADDGYELRCCTQCSKWFEPQLKSRSRFCSTWCRKMFNNVRNCGNDLVTTFVCPGCEETRSMDDFAGLRFEDQKEQTATPLRMGSYQYVSDKRCCIHCVRTKYPEWRRYIAPMESLSERAST
jgi:hypothetical protein